jgi:hypothetical protein
MRKHVRGAAGSASLRLAFTMSSEKDALRSFFQIPWAASFKTRGPWVDDSMHKLTRVPEGGQGPGGAGKSIPRHL